MQSPIIPIKNVGNDGENVISGLVDRFQRQYTYLRLRLRMFAIFVVPTACLMAISPLLISKHF